MSASAKKRELISMLRIAEEYQVIEEDDAVNILCLLKTDEQREEMMQYMAENPGATKQELFKKVIEIGKYELVPLDQI